MTRTVLSAGVIAATLATGVFSVSPTSAQNQPWQPSAEPSQNMQAMMKMHEQMLAQMKAANVGPNVLPMSPE
jgi:hypothetical protein